MTTAHRCLIQSLRTLSVGWLLAISAQVVTVAILASCGGAPEVQPTLAPTPTAQIGPSITNADPTVDSMSPLGAMAGSPDLTITVTGSNFRAYALAPEVVVWHHAGDETRLTTTIVSETRMTAIIPAALLANPGVSTLTLQKVDPLDGPSWESKAFPFQVNSAGFDY